MAAPNGYTYPARPAHSGDDLALVVVMGMTGAGKSSFLNLLTGRDSFAVGHGQRSCTGTVQHSDPFEFEGRRVVLVDTPGFDDTTRKETDILQEIVAFLTETYKKDRKIAGLIYLHRISDPRMGGMATRNFFMLRNLCGDQSLQNVVIATTWWDKVTAADGARNENNLASDDLFFKPALDKKARLRRHDSGLDSAQKILRCVLENTPRVLLIQQEIVDDGKQLVNTAAGAALNEELASRIKQNQQEIQRMKAQMEEARRTRDEESRKELEAEKAKMDAEVRRLQEEKAQLQSGKLFTGVANAIGRTLDKLLLFWY